MQYYTVYVPLDEQQVVHWNLTACQLQFFVDAWIVGQFFVVGVV
jgi:hypothetical protein